MRFTFGSAKRVVTVLGLAVTSVAVLSRPAPADTLATFDARAAANGVDVTMANPSIPLGLVLQGTGPVARAALDSLGTSEALAAGPYPGDLAASLPGTVRTTSGLPLPDYPLVAATSFGDEPEELVAPGMSLRAESRSQRSNSRATIGSESTGSTSTAEAERNDAGGVRATAVARSDVLRVLDRLTLSGVVAEASTTLDEMGNRTSSSSLRIDAIDAAGLVVTVPETTPKGGLADLPPIVSGQPEPPKPPPSEPTPLPGGGTTVTGPVLRFADGQFTLASGTGGEATETPVPTEAVAAAFKALGIEMTYQAAQPTDTGTVAPVLSFRTTLPAVPENPTAFQGPTTLTLDVGRVATSVTGQAMPDPTFGVDDPISDLPVAPGPGTSGSAVVAGTGSDPDLDAGGLAFDDLTGLGGGTGALGYEFAEGADPGSAPSEAALTAAPPRAATLARAGRTVDAGAVYVVFLVVAGVGLGAGSFLRIVGVRS